MAKKPAAKQQTPAAPAPAKTAASTAVATMGGKIDTTGMIVQGDKADLTHIKNTARGNENVGVEDLVIPRLEVVQGLSPAVKPGDPGFIEGCKQGDLVNSVTNRVYGREVFLVPVHYTKQWLVWKKFNEGGGFFGAFATPEEAEAKKVEVVKEGNKADHIEVVDTPTHLCLLVNHAEGRVEEVMLPLTRTKAKISRAWNTMVRMSGSDRFARVYRITTAIEKNKKGQEYWNFVLSQTGAPNKVLYELAEKLFNAVSKGEKKVVMDTKNMPGGDAGDDGDAGQDTRGM